MSRFAALVVALAVAFAPAVSVAASQKMFAQVTRVTGTAHHSYAALPDAREMTTIGARLFDGDTIVTDKGSRVELLLQSGGSMVVDEETTLVLTSLAKDERGALAYSFNLVIGRIKSFLSRTSGRDRIEYATKAAVAGIAGTPPHVIEAKKSDKGKIVAGVFLLKGSKGQLFVKGFDKAATTVLINPGMGTTVVQGLAPLAPFALTPAVLQSLEAIKATVMPSAPSAPSAPGGASGGSGSGATGASTGTSTAGTTAVAAGGMGTGTMIGIGAAAVGGVAVAAGASGGGAVRPSPTIAGSPATGAWTPSISPTTAPASGPPISRATGASPARC